MMLPIGTNRFDVGSSIRKKNRTPKVNTGWRRHTRPPAINNPATTASDSHADNPSHQWAASPNSGIWLYE